MITPSKFTENQPVLWVYTPKRTGDDYVVKSVVRQVLPDLHYIIETENQKGVKVREMDLREVFVEKLTFDV
jgi:hypothetical protein